MALPDPCLTGTVHGEEQASVSYVGLSDWSLGGYFLPVLPEKQTWLFLGRENSGSEEHD